MALTNVNDVSGRYISSASRFWWAYRIAFAWNLDPREVKQWDAEDVMEALAAIGIAEKNAKNQIPKFPKRPDVKG